MSMETSQASCFDWTYLPCFFRSLDFIVFFFVFNNILAVNILFFLNLQSKIHDVTLPILPSRSIYHWRNQRPNCHPSTLRSIVRRSPPILNTVHRFEFSFSKLQTLSSVLTMGKNRLISHYEFQKSIFNVVFVSFLVELNYLIY